jgi:hypothetical protein
MMIAYLLFTLLHSAMFLPEQALTRTLRESMAAGVDDATVRLVFVVHLF